MFKELQKKYQDKMRILREDLELRRKHEIHEIEERKNDHIFELMQKHATAFTEIKNYYNDITHNNLDLIKMLKDDVAKMRQSEAVNDKRMGDIKSENKKLREPLDKALKRVVELEHQLQNYEKDQVTLKQTKVRLAHTEKQLRNLDWENEVLQQRFVEVQRERDALYNKFEKSVYEVQRKAGLRSVLLERKLESLSEHL